MIRLAAFAIALLLAVGAVEPSRALLITLAVLTGIELLRVPRWPFRRRMRAWVRAPGLEYDW